MNKSRLNRRTFAKLSLGTALFGLAALQTETSHARILGANDRIQLGFCGIANRGGQLLTAFDGNNDQCDVAAICDIDTETLEKVKQRYNNQPFATTEYEKLLERADLDGIVLATPDHWHALQTIWACKAGKDVYCEKPLSITIVEGRKMVEAARKYNRVVQVGVHRRSAPHYRDLASKNLDQMIGFITAGRSARLSNMFPNGIGRCQASDAPAKLNWDKWLGPRQERPFQENIAPYKFRWWSLYSSQMANWGVHYMDAMRWLLKETAPSSVCAMGGRFAVDDDRTIPDTAEVMFQFKSGRLLSFMTYEANGNPVMATNEKYRQLGEFELRGTNGTLYVTDNGWQVKPERGGQFSPSKYYMEPMEGPGTKLADTERLHAKNFLDCMKTREKPNADVEEGHRSTTMSHLANISLQMQQRLEWDADKERFINNDAANELLQYEYRAPYKLEV